VIGLELALAFARARWMAACHRAFRQNKTKGDISEKLAREVEEAERRYQELKETKRERK
jgi:hypothetical protein